MPRRAILGGRLEGVGGREDPGGHGDPGSRQPMVVAAAVQSFMMQTRDAPQVVQEGGAPWVLELAIRSMATPAECPSR